LTTTKRPKKEAARKLKEPRITPEEYFEMLKGVDLVDLYLAECAASVNKEKIELQRELSFSWKDDVSYEAGSPDLLRAKHHFELTAPGNSKKDFLVKISCTFVLRYSTQQELSEDFLEIFIERNVPLNTWPYFRELVQNMTQRMNIPPLTLPLLK
jgi:preprotein translocase subunit SecB